MKYLFIISYAIFIFFINAVSKAETKWEEFTNNAKHIIYITEENLQITKGYVQFDFLYDFRKKNADISSMRVTYIIDCKKQKSAIKKTISYAKPMGKNKLREEIKKDLKWDTVLSTKTKVTALGLAMREGCI